LVLLTMTKATLSPTEGAEASSLFRIFSANSTWACLA